MKEYRLVFADADDTLFDFTAAERYALNATLRACGIIPDEQICVAYSHINKQLWLDYEQGKIAQELLRSERFRLLFQTLGILIDAGEAGKIYLHHLSESSFLMPDAVAVCSYLHEKYTLVLITNGISFVQRARLEKSPIKPYIDAVVISEEAQCSKPNPGIFSYAETLTGFHDKEKMIVVGDSLSSDIAGGINYGIDTCWLKNSTAAEQNGIQPTYTIHSLDEIRQIL